MSGWFVFESFGPLASYIPATPETAARVLVAVPSVAVGTAVSTAKGILIDAPFAVSSALKGAFQQRRPSTNATEGHDSSGNSWASDAASGSPAHQSINTLGNYSSNNNSFINVVSAATPRPDCAHPQIKLHIRMTEVRL